MTGSALSSAAGNGNLSVSFPSTIYLVHTGMLSIYPRISSLVTAIPVAFCIAAPYLVATRSRGPTLRGLPVLAPYSAPAFLRVSASVPCISHTNGPSPTHVEYALTTPIISLISADGAPAPTGAYLARVVDEVV